MADASIAALLHSCSSRADAGVYLIAKVEGLMGNALWGAFVLMGDAVYSGTAMAV